MKYPIKKIKKEIEKQEEKTGKKLSPKGRKKVERKVIRRTKRRNRMIAILAVLGITVSGAHALLGDGSQPKEPEVKTERNTSKKDAYINELKDMSLYDNTTQTKENNEKDTKIVDEILKKYNENLLDQEKINKKDLGIIFQDDVSDGHIIKETSENAEVSYIADFLSGTEQLEENQEWIEAEDIDSIYVLVDNKHKNILGGIGKIEGKFSEVDVEDIMNGDREEYVKNDKTYVGIPKDKNKEKIYDNFGNYYKERIEQKSQENDDMELG